jgi:predicted metal-dependent hydrolase
VEEERAPGEKTKRPRDELGRHLPWGSENRLQLEDFDNLSPEENHRLAIEHFNAGRFFPAHEAWETVWKQSKGTPDEEFFKGLSQLGAGYTHYRRGNAHGSHVLMRRALSRITRFGDSHHGIDLERLVAEVERHAGAVEEADRNGEPMPEIEPPKIGEVKG